MITALILILIIAVAGIFAVVYMMGGSRKQSAKAAEKTSEEQINR